MDRIYSKWKFNRDIVLVGLFLIGFSSWACADSQLLSLAKIEPSDTATINDWVERNLIEAKSVDDSAAIYLQLGAYLVENFKYDLAEKLLTNCLGMSLENEQSAQVHFQLGLSYMYRDLRVISLQHYHDALSLFEKSNNLLGMGMALDKIADNHNYMGEHEIARPYYDQCIYIFTEIGDTSRLTNILDNIGGMMDEEQMPDSAIVYYRRALNLAKQIKDTTNMRMIFSGLAMAYEQNESLDTALEYHQKAYMLAYLGGDKIDRGFANQHLGYFYYRQGDHTLSREYMETTLQLAREMNNTQLLVNSMEVLSDLAYKEKSYKEAYDYYVASDNLYDSLFTLQNTAQMEAIRSAYEIQKKEAENAVLKKEAELKEEVIRNQQFYTGVLSIGAVLLLIASIALFMLNHIRRKKNKEIKEDRDLIQKQTSKLKELDGFKSRFFANVSHDLASPLTLIKGYTELLKREKKELSEETIEFLGYIEDNVDRLKNLTEEIQQLNRLENHSFKLVYTDLEIDSLLTRMVNNFRSVNGHLEFEYQSTLSDDFKIQVDKAAFEKVVYNLIDNAYKYNTTGTRIDLKAFTEEDFFVLEVIDDGPGIAEDKQDDIFKRFFQIKDEEGSEIAGQGIGLSLVKELIELHGGCVKITSQPNVATCFQISVPIKREVPVIA